MDSAIRICPKTISVNETIKGLGKKRILGSERLGHVYFRLGAVSDLCEIVRPQDLRRIDGLGRKIYCTTFSKPLWTSCSS